MTPGIGFTEHVENRVLAFRLGAVHEGRSKTDFFDFIGFDTVLTDVLDTILRPMNSPIVTGRF